MATKLSSPRVEARALRALCSQKAEVSGFLSSEIDESYFNHEESKEILTRIDEYRKRKGSPPVFRLLCEDPKLSEESREFLEMADVAIKNKEHADQVLEDLSHYRKLRFLWNISKVVITKLQAGNKVDPSDLLSKVSDQLAKASLRKADKDSINKIGGESTVGDVIKKIIYERDEAIAIPTGFDSFDRNDGGFPVTGLTVLGGNTGGGKSLISWQIAMNQAALGYKVVFVPLEMSLMELLGRTVANKSGLNNANVQLRKLATGEQDLAYKRFRSWERKIEKAGGELIIFKPKEDMTIQEILGAVSFYRAHIIYVDYISLLKGTDGDDQWRALGSVARYSKIYAEGHNNAIVLLAQVDNEGMLRYSRAVGEHASTGWAFVATRDSKDKGYLKVTPFKGRNQSMRPFILKMDYATQRASDPTPEDLESFQKKVPATASKKEGAKSNDDKYMPDLSGE